MTAQLRRPIFSGGLWIMLEWIPGVAVALGSGFLAFWRAAAVTEERVNTLKDQLGKEEMERQRVQKQLSRDVRDALDRLSNVATEMKVLAATQREFNSTAVETLKTLIHRLENHDTVLMQHHTDIAILKAQGQ